MSKSIKMIISYFIVGLVTIFTYVIIINDSSKDLYNPTYIEKELSRISVTDIINSSIFDDNINMQKIRKNINSVYKVADILDIPRDKVTSLINSKISTDVITKIVINVMDTLITEQEQELFNVNDYNKIVDDNIELILTEINLELNSEETIILSKILKEVGEKIIKDVPSTDIVLDKIDANTLNIIKIISSKQVRYILIIVDIVLLIILILLNLNSNIIKFLLKGSICLLLLLLLTTIVVLKLANTFNNEWLFIKRFILYFNYNVILSMTYLVIITLILSVIHHIIKRKALEID